MNISMRDVFLVATLIVVVVVDVTLGISPPTNSTAPRHTCIHDKIAAKIKIKSVVIPGLHEDFGSVARRSAPGKSPMRLKLDYSSFSHLSNVDVGYTCHAVGATVTANDQNGNTISYTCTQADVLTEGKINYIKSLLSEAKGILEQAFAGALAIPGLNNCPESSDLPLPVPEVYRTPGSPDTDLVIFITARPVLTNGTLAFAAQCAEDTFTKRAVAGFMNFNPAQINPADASDRPSQLGTALHEITHVLGFSFSKLKSFFDPTTNSTIPIDNVVLSTPGPGGVNLTKIITPKVVEFAKEHFGCASLTGVELENGGGSGTARSHWEKRILNTEYMIGQSTKFPVFSAFTLAFFEDSGWYNVNYSMAKQLYWGLKAGCAFVNSNCKNGWPREGYWCEAESNQPKYSCNFDRTAKAFCPVLASYSTALPVEYRYFDQPNKGGSDSLADYCPYWYAPPENYCTDETKEGGSGLLDTGENYGPDCRCFDHNLVKNLPTGSLTTSQGCFKTACAGPDRLKIKLGNYWYTCPTGSEIKADSFGGSLKCPGNMNLCYNVTDDGTWPEFLSIEPNEGNPGDFVVIKGYNFVDGMKITIHDEASCTFIDSTEYQCTIADSAEFRSPTHLLSESVSVIMEIPGVDKSTVGYNAFTVRVKLDSDYFLGIIEWLGDNPIATAFICLGIVLGIMLCCYCCYRERKKARYGFRRPTN